MQQIIEGEEKIVSFSFPAAAFSPGAAGGKMDFFTFFFEKNWTSGPKCYIIASRFEIDFSVGFSSSKTCA
jgi:hypothetical protein